MLAAGKRSNADEPGMADDESNGSEESALQPGADGVPKWLRPALLGTAPVILAALYFLALPVLIIFLEAKDMLPYSPGLGVFYELIFYPITWLYENVTWFQNYIDWLDQVIV